jgi:hypothetical protein
LYVCSLKVYNIQNQRNWLSNIIIYLTFTLKTTAYYALSLSYSKQFYNAQYLLTCFVASWLIVYILLYSWEFVPHKNSIHLGLLSTLKQQWVYVRSYITKTYNSWCTDPLSVHVKEKIFITS